MNTDVTVRDVMTREYVGVSEGDGLVDTVELMLEEDADSVVVLRGREPVGVLTGRDVLAVVADGDRDIAEATVADAMSPRVPSVSPDLGVDGAADAMSAEGVRGLLVTEGEEPLGLVTEHDLFSAATLEPPRDQELLAAGNGPPESRADAEAGDEFVAQSICQECGALTRDLADVGGHLVCADCRDV